MINDHGEAMIEHHTHYKELHGFDKTVWMTWSEHRNLHIRLRKEGKCNVSSDKLKKIAKAAHKRTDKSKKQDKDYRKTGEGIDFYRKYQKNYYYIDFSDTPEPHTQFKERIIYNYATGTVTYHADFRATNSHKLIFIDI